MLVKVLRRIYSICAKLLLMRKWVFLCLLFLPFFISAAEREIRIGLIDTFDQDFWKLCKMLDSSQWPLET